MIYKTSLIDILRGVVQSMSFTVTIDSVSGADGNYTLATCDYYHAEPGRTVTIGGETFTIATIDTGRITLTTAATLAEDFWDDHTTFELYPPYFYHGTPLATETELKQENNAANKTPMVWLNETYTEVFDDDPARSLERESRFRLFFLTQANHHEWLTQEAYEKAIEPMQRLSEQFINTLKRYKIDCDLIFYTDHLKYTRINYAKFGVYITNAGVPKSLFADKLAGCELDMTVSLWKRSACPC